MNILLVSATDHEISPLKKRIGSFGAVGRGNHNLQFVVTGVGMVATAYNLGKYLAAMENFDLVINVGIAGSFKRSFELGEVVNVTQDVIYEMGAEDGQDFISADKLGLVDESLLFFKGSHPFKSNTLSDLKVAKGITVNKVHGNNDTIALLQENNNPDVETMEGAAFFYACKQAQLPAIQLRSISNYVEERDTRQWKIDLSINNLATKTIEVIEDIK